MTDEEEAVHNATADAFLRMVKNAAPDKLSDIHIVHLCGWFTATYAEDKDEAQEILARLIRVLARYYDWVETGVGVNETTH